MNELSRVSKIRKKRKRMKRLLSMVFAVVLFGMAAGAVFLLQNVGSGRFSSEYRNISAALKEAGVEPEGRLDDLIKNEEKYPQRLLEALQHNGELLDFTLGYPDKLGTYAESITLEQDPDRGIPLFMQWDAQWGYARYGSGCIGLDGCGPTCLSMVLVGLTGDTSYNPKMVADYSMQNGYVSNESSTSWSLMSDGAEGLGLSVQEVPLSEDKMIEALAAGHPMICTVRPGDFTTTGHFIVVYKYADGAFFVNDPNSKKRSGQSWSYETLSPQIKAMWAYTKQGA